MQNRQAAGACLPRHSVSIMDCKLCWPHFTGERNTGKVPALGRKMLSLGCLSQAVSILSRAFERFPALPNSKTYVKRTICECGGDMGGEKGFYYGFRVVRVVRVLLLLALFCSMALHIIHISSTAQFPYWYTVLVLLSGLAVTTPIHPPTALSRYNN